MSGAENAQIRDGRELAGSRAASSDAAAEVAPQFAPTTAELSPFTVNPFVEALKPRPGRTLDDGLISYEKRRASWRGKSGKYFFFYK